MRFWVLALAASLVWGCASSDREEGLVWCEHEGMWSEPHPVRVASPDPLDLDLIGGADPRETARVEAYAAALAAGAERNEGLLVYVSAWLPPCQGAYYEGRSRELPTWDEESWSEEQRAIEVAYRSALAVYEPALLADLERGHPALWQRLADVFRLGRRQASEVAWRKLGDSARGGRRLRLSFSEADSLADDLTQRLCSLDSGRIRPATVEHYLSDWGFKELMRSVRRTWRLAGADPRPLTRALKRWRRRAQATDPEAPESLEALSQGAERYRDRALDAALEATLAAEESRAAAPAKAAER